MATTEDTFQSDLDAIKVAVAAHDWATAWEKYTIAEISLSGLMLKSQHSEALMQRRESLSAVRKAIEHAEASITAKSDRRRFITTSVGFGNSK